MAQHKIETNTELQCPCCSAHMNGATNIDDDSTLPTDGSLSVCMYCGCMLQYKGKGMNLKLVVLTEAVKKDVKANHPEQWILLCRAQYVILMQKQY